MNKVYINNQSKRNFDTLRTYLVNQFRMTSQQTSKVKANLKARLDYFVVGGVTFENRRAFK